MNRRTDTLPTIPFSLAALGVGGGMCVPLSYMCALEGICSRVRGDARGEGVRCGGGVRRWQRGVGVDHLAQVQQKNVQTATHLLSSVTFSIILHSLCCSYSSLCCSSLLLIFILFALFMPVQDCVRYYSTPSPITTLEGTVVESYNSSKASNLYLESCYRRQSVQNTADFVISGDGSVILRDPWVLVTLLVTLANLVL